jgi:hypothetical protein
MKNIFQYAVMLCCIFCLTVSSNKVAAQIVPDSQLKVKVNSISNPSEKLMKLEPGLYTYSTDRAKALKLPSGAQYGFLTENFEQVFPELVRERSVSQMFGKNAYRSVRLKTVDHSGLVPVLVATVKEQQTAIAALQQELQALRKRLDSMAGTN